MTLKVWYCAVSNRTFDYRMVECLLEHSNCGSRCGRRLLINPDDERTWQLVKDAIEDWFEATHYADVVSFGEAASAVLHALEVE